MRWYVKVMAVAVAAILVIFGVATALGLVPGEGFVVGERPWVGALVGVCLLGADAMLPVPSTIVMAALGHSFGPVMGTLLSTVGLMVGSVVAFGAGRIGASAGNRPVDPVAVAPQTAIFVALLRGVPVLGEASAVTAGATGMSWRTFVGASLAGAVPVAVASAMTGHFLGDALPTIAIATVVLVVLVGAAARALAATSTEDRYECSAVTDA